jgi:hypothetical protein
MAKRMATAGIGAAGTPGFSILPVTIWTSPMAYLPGDTRRWVWFSGSHPDGPSPRIGIVMEVWPVGAVGETAGGDRLGGEAGMIAGWDRLGIPGTAARRWM